MLKVNNIDVFYGNLQVLYEISFDVNKGEIVTLLGPNGAGKTTTLKAINGILKPARGSISFFGERIDTLPPHEIAKRGIASVMEGRRLFTSLSVLENLMVGAFLENDRKKLEDKIEYIYNLFPILRERKNQLAKTLSGGEAQMLAIARALLMSPKILLLDEPTLGLAPKIVKTVFQVIRKLNEEGLTILLVEQHVHEALKICDRAYVLENGKIVLEGKGQEFLSRVDDIRRKYLGI
ncbi:MAG: ABC transporter ATP-binding protein [candidate division WOR-3 bacterium]